jgi:hypothetical protein
VLVSLDGGGTWQAATATVGQSTWRLASQTLSASNTLKVKVQDSAGNDGAVYSQAYVLDTIKPTLSIATVAVDDIVNATEKGSGVTVSGSSNAEANQTVRINWGSQVKTATVDSNGQWQATFAAGDVPADASSSTITAVVDDLAGNSSDQASRSVRIDTVAPTVSIGIPLTGGAGVSGDADNILNKAELDAVPANGGLLISGLSDAEVGQTLSLRFNDLSYTTTVQAGASGSTWSLSIPKADLLLLSHGNSYTMEASVSDSAGNPATVASRTLDVKLAPPDVPTVAVLNSNDTTPVITGSAQKINATSASGYSALETGDTLAVTVDSQVYTLTVGNSASSPAGLRYSASTSTWSLDRNSDE